MPKKVSAFELLAARPSDTASPVDKELDGLCTLTAKHLAKEIIRAISATQEGAPPMRTRSVEAKVTRLLEVELHVFAILAGRPLAKTESMRRRVLAESGKAKRFRPSKKTTFLAWVAEHTKSNPKANPSELVKRFIEAHPKLDFNFETGLRYLRPSSRGR